MRSHPHLRCFIHETTPQLLSISIREVSAWDELVENMGAERSQAVAYSTQRNRAQLLLGDSFSATLKSQWMAV